jgi:hypothetical protein
MGFLLSRLTFDAIDEYGRYLARVSAGWVVGDWGGLRHIRHYAPTVNVLPGASLSHGGVVKQ